MTRIALIGDTHADERGRFDEHNRIMQWIGEDAADRGVDLFLHSGDVWERRSSSRERIAVADWARAWTEHAPLVVVAGNHDDPLDIEWLGRLRSRHPIHAVTRPQVVLVGGAGVAVACLPWPRKANLLAQLGNVSREEADQAAVQALRGILSGLGQELDGYRSAEVPRVFLGHVQVSGSRVSISQPLVGMDLELSLADLALVQAQFLALGHIHLGAGNEWDIAGAPAAYPGSPRRCNFGETEEKGYILIDFDDSGQLAGWQRIETPCTPMVHLDTTYAGDSADLLFLDCGRAPTDAELRDLANGAEVRLRYRVRTDEREAGKAAALDLRDAILEAGAISVKVEEVLEVEQRARTPEVAAAVTLEDKLAAFWRAKGFDPGERREALVGKLHAAESEARNAS